MNQTPPRTIGIFLNTSWNIYNFRLPLLRKLQEEGYRVVTIAPEDEFSERLVQAGFEFYPIDINNMGTNPLEDFKLTVAIYRLYQQIKPDLMLHYTIKPNIYGSIAARWAGIPVISNISGLGTVFLSRGLSSRVAQILYRIALQIPGKVFFQNPHDLEHFVKNKLVAANKVDLLPGSGINPEHYLPVKKTGRAGQPFVFLLIARMLKDKGVVEFVRAAMAVLNTPPGEEKVGHSGAGYSGVEFWLLGSLYPGNPSAIEQEQIDTWTQNKGIKYLGYTDDVMSVIGQSDCVVLPSYREGLSRVLLEAASMAQPIITTDVPGCKDMVDDGVNGFLCKVQDIGSLAEQMYKMLSISDAERAAMGAAGRRKVIEGYSEEVVIDKYLEAIDGVFA